MPLLKLQNLGKKFNIASGEKWSLQNFDLEMESGKIYGLLGPNGAGKTTLIRILTQISLADTGEIFLNNKKLSPDDRNIFGYMPEERGLYPKMSVFRQLMYFAQLRGLSHTEAKNSTNIWLEKFNILDWKDKKILDLSKGMQQKIQFIVSVIHDPAIVILDEPLSGLDPINSELINQQILEFKALGKLVIFSTHRMEQAEQICDNVVMISNGKKVLEGALSTIKQANRQGLCFFQTLNSEKALEIFKTNQIEVLEFDIHKNYFKCELSQPENLSVILQNLILEAGLQGFGEVLPTLGEIFLRNV